MFRIFFIRELMYECSGHMGIRMERVRQFEANISHQDHQLVMLQILLEFADKCWPILSDQMSLQLTAYYISCNLNNKVNLSHCILCCLYHASS